MSAREFETVSPQPVAWLLPLATIGIIFFGIILLLIDRGPYKAVALVALLAVVVTLIWMVAMLRRRIVLQDGVLHIAAGINNARVSVGKLDLDAARIVDLASHSGLKPLLRINGTSTLGYNSGHFLLRDKGRGFLLVTERSRVLVLPERSGRRILLSLTRPQQLLDVLRTLHTSATN